MFEAFRREREGERCRPIETRFKIIDFDLERRKASGGASPVVVDYVHCVHPVDYAN